MSQESRRAVLVAAIGQPCPYCWETMGGPDRWPTRDHIKPRLKGYRLTADNQAIVCAPCNKAKGSLSLQRFANRLARAGDPRALCVAALCRFVRLRCTARLR
ncbi:HNH endonuclease signature motif containing protein [Reyranella soli]|uniref:HNH endonuclease signature motif containing protein n=1 Tax=Reyranella soli TaxID=1230389 RepID=UPI0011BE5CBF